MFHKKFTLFTLAALVGVMICAAPVCANSLAGVVNAIESSIQSSMSSSGIGGGPTLGQLGGVQAGSTAGGDLGGGNDALHGNGMRSSNRLGKDSNRADDHSGKKTEPK